MVEARRVAVTCIAAGAMACTNARTQSAHLSADASVSGADAGYRRICDGSSAIRFAYRFAVGSVLEQVSTLYDLGTDYLYVDGSCHYWVDQPSTVVDEYKYWRTIREGVLSASEEAALHSAVGYDDVTKSPACLMSNTADIGVASMWNGEQTYSCPGGPDASPDWPMRSELYAAGSAVDGAMRIKVSVVPVQANDLQYEWPLGSPIANYLVDDDGPESFRIEDDSAAYAIRRLRDRLIADATRTPGYYRGYIGILPGPDVINPGEGYALAARDDLPFTDEAGRWSPPQ